MLICILAPRPELSPGGIFTWRWNFSAVPGFYRLLQRFILDETLKPEFLLGNRN